MLLSELNSKQIFTFPNRKGEYIFDTVITTGSGKYVIYHSRRMQKVHIETLNDANSIEVSPI